MIRMIASTSSCTILLVAPDICSRRGYYVGCSSLESPNGTLIRLGQLKKPNRARRFDREVIDCFGPSFDFDDTVKRIAIRAVEMRCRAFERHRFPPNSSSPNATIPDPEGCRTFRLAGPFSKAQAIALYSLIRRALSFNQGPSRIRELFK